MSRRLLRTFVTLAVAALVSLPAAAFASPHGRIVQVTTTNGSMHLLFTTTGVGADSAVVPDSVQVTIDGTPVPAKASLVGSTTAKVDRSALLVIDTSGSMAGPGLLSAKAAASAFLTAVPADVRVGLVTFADTARVDVAPTADRSAVRRAISSLHASGETALYDGVALGLHELGDNGGRTIVLLTDGADTRSKAKLPTLLPQIQASKVTIEAVGFRTTDAQAAPLLQIADNGGGQVIAATHATTLASAFKSAAQDISHQLVVTATVPPEFQNSSHTIGVTASTGSATLIDTVFAPIGAAEAVKSTNPADYGAEPIAVDYGVSRTVLFAALMAFFAAVAVLLSVALSGFGGETERAGVRRRLSIYTLTGRPVEESREETTTVIGDSAVARSAMELAGRVVSNRDFESQLGLRLEAAGVPMKPAEWLILHTGAAVVGGLLFLLISGGGLLATAIGVVLGLAGPWFYLSWKESRRTNAFLERMPDTLQLMAGSLLAGYSLPQSVDAVVREGSEPIAGEFNRALVETRLGVTVEDALEGVAKRMRSVDFEWVVMAIRIQREVGGNLAEVLTTVSATLRERERLRRQVRVLSAEGRLSAWILGGLPPLFFVYLLLVRHEYVSQLWTDSLGVALMVFLVVNLTIGALWLRKVIRVEV
jgi:tight adherence protein B